MERQLPDFTAIMGSDNGIAYKNKQSSSLQEAIRPEKSTTVFQI